MRIYGKTLIAAIGVTLLLAAAVGTASARRLEVSNTGIRSVWPAEGKLTFFSGEISVACSVTLEGTLHSRIISKVSGQLVGFITRAALTRPCAGGEAWILNGSEVQEGVTLPNTLPWHVRYDSFRESLPRITGIRVQLIGAAFLLNILGVRCLFKSTAARPAFGIIERSAEGGAADGEVTGLRADETPEIPKFEGGILCPGSGRFRGRGNVTLLGTTTRIRVRLVA